MAEVILKQYSEAFKRQVVREYEAGASQYALKQKYGITGHGTIAAWVKQYGLVGFRHEVIRIQTMEEANRVKELEGKLREMESVVSHLLLENLMLQSTLTVLEEEYGIDVKKNAVRSLSELAGKRIGGQTRA